MECAIGIDVGTTNSKVVLCELPSCNVLHVVKFESPKRTDGAGHVDFDLAALERSLTRALSESVSRVPGSTVVLISVASVGESGALVFPDGTHSETSIAWFDTRGASYADELHEMGAARQLYKVTGIPAHANYGLFKLLWLRDHGVRIEGGWWLPLGDYIAWWLSGEVYQDESLASRTFMLDMANKRPAKEILNRYGIDEAMLPPLMESGCPRGTVRKAIARETGLSTACAVCVAGHDHMAGSVACSLAEQGELLNSTGTSEGILTLNRQPVLTDESFSRRLSNGIYVRSGLYSYYASLPTAGYALSWLCDTLAFEEDSFFGPYREGVSQRYRDAHFRGRELLFIPHLRGSGPPRRNVKARGCVYGISDSTTREDIVFSAYLGLAFEFGQLFDCMIGDDGASAFTLAKVTGPAVRSTLWMQLKADLLGIEARACRVNESVARGAAMLAAQKAGYDVDLDFEYTSYYPDDERHAYLEELYESQYLPLAEHIASFEGDRR